MCCLRPRPHTSCPGALTDEDSPSYKAKVGISLFSLVAIAVLKTQLTAYLFSSGPYPTAYSLWSCVVTCVMLLPFFFIPCCFPDKFPQQWGYPTLKNKHMSKQPPADATCACGSEAEAAVPV